MIVLSIRVEARFSSLTETAAVWLLSSAGVKCAGAEKDSGRPEVGQV